MAPTPPNIGTSNLKDIADLVKPLTDKDAALGRDVVLDLATGDVNAANQALAKAEAKGLSAQTASIHAFISTHTFDKVSKTWGTLPDIVNNAQGLAGAVVPDVGSFLSALTNPHTWLRVLEAQLGIILVAVGVAMVLKNTDTGKSLYNAGKSAAMKAVVK